MKACSPLNQLTGPEFLHLLLTLDSLESIVIVDRITGRGRGQFYRRPGVTNASRGWDDCRIGGSWPGCDEQAWRRYRYRTSAIPAGIVRQGREIEAGDTSTIVLARPTDRPIEVLTLVAAGYSNGQIATSLFVSDETASVHVSHILDKLGVASRTEAATIGVRLGLPDLERDDRSG